MKEVKEPKKPLLYYYGIALLIILIFNAVVMPFITERRITNTDYGTFIDMTEQNEISAVEIQEQENRILFQDKESNQLYQTGMVEDPELTARLNENDVRFSGEIIQQASPIVSFFLTWILPLLFFIGIGQYISKKMMDKAGGGKNAMNFGMTKSNAKVYVESTDGVTFSDVAGQDEAKESLEEVTDYLHNPERYQRIGAQMPTGMLLVGPPGTGKTLLARAVAGEANVPFFSISGSEFIEMFAGAGAARVRDLFKQAKEKSPCIIFIDEIDAIGKKRGQSIGNDEREQTLNQLLTEMDGFEKNSGVMILAATNQPDSLDPALLRPGRFDRQIPVELPDLQGREEILRVHAKNIIHENNIDFNKIARMASGASGAELANVINEGALRAIREGRNVVNQRDLEESIEVVIAGYEKKNAILSDKEKMIVSYHEIGHALVAAKQSNSAPVEKITIVPRTSGALGYTMQVPTGNNYLMSKEQLLEQLATLAGGRAAEELIFGSITTGASNDIEKMTQIARSMITQYGMSDNFGMVQLESANNQYLSEDTHSNSSPETQRKVDQEVIQLVQQQYDKAYKILEENKEKLNILSEYLYREETITGNQFMKILEQ
jgi:cell division protease FtsH